MRRVFLVFGAAAVLSTAAQASFVFNDFSSVAGLQLNGSAAQAGNALRLVPAAFNAGGSAFTSAQVSLGGLNSFSTLFTFQITNSGGIGDEDGAGADGLVFVVQTVNNNVGGVGGSIGYAGISPSLGIEFDTFNNGMGGFNDPTGNHVGIDTNGNIASIATTVEPTRFNNGSIWNAWVDYDGNTNALEVRWSMSNVRPVAAQLASNINLTALLGQNTAYLGFTSGTGSGIGDHDILSWEYRDSFNPIGGGQVPEPASMALLAVGSLGLIGLRRRSQKAAA